MSHHSLCFCIVCKLSLNLHSWLKFTFEENSLSISRNNQYSVVTTPWPYYNLDRDKYGLNSFTFLILARPLVLHAAIHASHLHQFTFNCIFLYLRKIVPLVALNFNCFLSIFISFPCFVILALKVNSFLNILKTLFTVLNSM